MPKASAEQTQICECLSNALIYLHRPEAQPLPSRGLMVAFFEQWLNGLVYELFFPGELHARNLRLCDYTAGLPFPTDPASTTYVEDLQAVFQTAHDLKRPLRGMLADLQTIEEVMIIEGEKITP